MKKGFTLIELLSVIIILGIILAIAIPTITNVMNTSKIETYKNNVEKLMIKVDEYISENISVLPTSIGETKEISLIELKENNYIKELKSPFNNDSCSGYILVTKTELDYELIPHINCYENINNSIEDKLVLHYTFDEFQEPTQNLLYTGENINWTIGNLVTTVTRTTIVLNEKYLITSGPSSGTFRFYVPLAVLTNGETYTLSYKYKINSGTTFNMADWGDTQLTNVVNVEYNDYTYSSASGTRATYDSTFRFMDFNISGNTSVEIWDVQLEKKSYSTEFVNGSRNGTVYDLSTNSNHSTLSLTTTPRWVLDEERDNGGYLFTNQIINMGTGNTFFPLNTFTISSWIKTPGLGSGMSLNGIVSITYGLTFYIDSSGNLNLRMDNGSSTPSTNVVKNLYNNEWYHVVGLFDGTNQKIYINGELMRTSLFTNWSGTTRWPTNSATIGQENNNGSVYRFNGLIDDVRIYNRALSENEVKLLYELNK